MARISIGLDIGHRHVRAVALAPARNQDARNGMRARVVALASVDRLASDGTPKPLAAALAEIETMLGKRGAIQAHFGDAKTLVRLVPTMALPPDKRQRLLRLELLQHADEAGDLAADAWEIAVPGEEILHGCVIGQPAQILAGLTEVARARLPAPAVSYAPAAIANCVAPGQIAGDTLALIVDIGSTTTGLTLMRDGCLLACRQLPIGGEAFTEALMASGLDRHAAETRKIQGERPVRSARNTTAIVARALPGLSSEEPLATTAKPADDGDALFADDPKPATGHEPAPTPMRHASTVFYASDLVLDDEPPLSPVAAKTAGTIVSTPNDQLELDDSEDPPAVGNAQQLDDSVPLPLPGAVTISVGRTTLGPELLRTAEAFYGQLAASVLWFKTQLRLERLHLDQVWLVGGGAQLAGLDTYLARRFNTAVSVFDPFTHLTFETPQPPADTSAWAAAVGLALAPPHLGGADAINLDVRPESLVRAEFRRRHQIWPYVAAAFLLAASLCVGIVLWRGSAARHETIEAYAAWKAKQEEMSRKLSALDADKSALTEDLRAIAGRIYAGRDLLYTVRALKEQAERSQELWVIRLETQGIGRDPVAGDALGKATPTTTATAGKTGYDSAIDRGAVLIRGKVKFGADKTDTGRDQFLKSWREALAAWKPASDAPTLFLKQRMVEWDPNHRPSAKPGAKAQDEGEFPFQVEFTFRPTQLDQITNIQTETRASGQPDASGGER
jgi:hypothetical protein